MKFITVLLAVLAVFSSAVLSQKVDPFASSSAVATVKDDVSPITDPASRTTPNTEHLQIKESIADGRELEEVCKKFVNYIAVDDKTTPLHQWCSSNSCCQNSCLDWSTTATYEVCRNSCNGAQACFGVARSSATSGATIKFDEGSCNSEYSCYFMAAQATSLQTLNVGKNSCSGPRDSCLGMAEVATNLQTLIIGENSCSDDSSCFNVARTAQSLKQLVIADEQCKSSFGCFACGRFSTFDDTLKLTETCCAADSSGNTDEACNYFDLTSNEPSLIPSTSSIPSAQPNGELNEVCKKFQNGFALDRTTRLEKWCDESENNCCQGLYACDNWSPAATYEVCKDSCNNILACNGVANQAHWATIKFDEGSCSGTASCEDMATDAWALQTLIVGKNSCSSTTSCKTAAANSQSLKQLIIADEQCKSFRCYSCGADSTFDDTLQLTETCCTKVDLEPDGSNVDVACNYFDLTSNQPSISSSPSESNLPSTSSIPSDQPSSLPSLVPSDIPSDSPSDQPSSLPSLMPSDIPSFTSRPSNVPSQSLHPSTSIASLSQFFMSVIMDISQKDEFVSFLKVFLQNLLAIVDQNSIEIELVQLSSQERRQLESETIQFMVTLPTRIPDQVVMTCVEAQLAEAILIEFGGAIQQSGFEVIVSDVPSSTPSEIPSDAPSDKPSSLPTNLPSNTPSSSPSASDLPSSIPSDVPSDIPSSIPSSMPSDISSDIPSNAPSDIPSDQPSLLPSLMPSNEPSDIPSDIPSDQPSSLPSLVQSDIPSDSPSDQPSNLPSSEPTWLDDEQCKKKHPKNDTCTKLGGRCKINCVDDENYYCVPDLCSYNKKWNKPTKKPKLRELMNEEEEIVEMEISAIGNTGRKLKTPKAPKLKTPKAPKLKTPKASKATKSNCACRVPKNK